MKENKLSEPKPQLYLGPFHIIYPATPYTTLHQHGAILKIEFAPLRAEYFADPKSQALRDQNHRAVWFCKVLEQFTVRTRGRFSRLLASFTRTREAGFLPSSITMWTNRRIIRHWKSVSSTTHSSPSACCRRFACRSTTCIRDVQISSLGNGESVPIKSPICISSRFQWELRITTRALFSAYRNLRPLITQRPLVQIQPSKQKISNGWKRGEHRTAFFISCLVRFGFFPCICSYTL